MQQIKSCLCYFTKTELALWGSSLLFIVLSFIAFDRVNYLTLVASLIGASSLIFNAKGNPLGQVLIIIFSILYGIISYGFSYYGEMISYLGMTAPMAFFALISWLRNPYNGNRAEVKVNQIKAREILLMFILAAVITVLFYFILTAFHTANIIPSTISITTSFIAVYLTARRSPYFALAYAANDTVLIFLWAYASAEDRAYLSVLVCFVMFLLNDLYGLFSWLRMRERQRQNPSG